jgi:MerR family Zn(II)-responsive transcriptional regulator of zntA
MEIFRMLIGELSQTTGLSRDTIRFYEKVGLLTPVQRNAENGYKEYDEHTVERLNLITQAKTLGFTLSEIQQGVDAWQRGQISQDEKIQLIQSKIEQINDRIQKFSDLKAYLMAKLDLVKQGKL